MRVVAIIQARTSSKRLPKKVLKPLPYQGNVTVLQHVIRRVKKAKKVDDVVVATTFNEEDDIIIRISNEEDVKWFRGSEEDVLERYYLCALENKADIIVRVTSDCPCIDSAVIDLIVKEHIKGRYDYTSNTIMRSYPRGMDVEVFNFNALEEAYRKSTRTYEREHVTPYIYKTCPKIFRIGNVIAPKDLSFPDIRITIDTNEDYALLCAVFDFLYYENEFFNLKDIINLFNKKPWLRLINEKVEQKKLLETLEEEIEEAKRILEFQGLLRAKSILENCHEYKSSNSD